jgi:hypothetical protein
MKSQERLAYKFADYRLQADKTPIEGGRKLRGKIFIILMAG